MAPRVLMSGTVKRSGALTIDRVQEIDDIRLITTSGCACAACHKPIGINGGVYIGRASFKAPAVNVCVGCLVRATMLVLKVNDDLRGKVKERRKARKGGR